MTEAAAATHEDGDDAHGRSVEITVVNEDNGKHYKLNADQSETLTKVIEKMYKDKLKLAHKPDDRLRCESSGEDVFSFAAQGMTVAAYFRAGHCPNHTWLFAAGTGGA